MAELKYLRVRTDLIGKMRGDAVILYGYLRYIEKRRKPDGHGYFTLDSNYVERGLHFDRFRLNRARGELKKLGLIDYLAGQNQNRKPRYKIL